MAPISIHIKASNDQKLQVSMEPESTVLQLKEDLASKADVAVERQRLIFSGKVLKNEETLASYKVGEGHTIHLVKGAAPTGSSSASQPPSQQQVPQNLAAGTSVSNPLSQITGARYAGQVPLPPASSFGPDAGMGGFGGAGGNRDDMLRMLEDPMVQSQMNEMWQNPQFVDMLLNSMPQFRNAPPYVRQMIQSPEFRRAMTDSNTIRQMSQMQQSMGAMGGGMGGGMFPGAQGGASFPMPGETRNPSEQPQSQTDTQQNTSSNTQQGAGQQPNPFSFLMGNQGGQSGDAQNNLGSLMQSMGNQQPAGSDQGQNNNPMAGNPFMNPNLMSMLSAMGGGQQMGGGFGQQNSGDTRPPEERFEVQIGQLVGMGFEYERAKRACVLTGGNVEAAVEMLFGGSV